MPDVRADSSQIKFGASKVAAASQSPLVVRVIFPPRAPEPTTSESTTKEIDAIWVTSKLVVPPAAAVTAVPLIVRYCAVEVPGANRSVAVLPELSLTMALILMLTALFRRSVADNRKVLLLPLRLSRWPAAKFKLAPA